MLKKMRSVAAAVGRVLRSRSAVAAVLAVAGAATVVTVSASAQTVAIYDGEEVRTIRTFSSDPETILHQAGVQFAEDDLIAMRTDAGYPAVTLTRAFDVTVTAGNETYAYRTTGGTVDQALQDLGLQIGEHDLVSAELSDRLSPDMYIDVISVDYEMVTQEVPISYQATTEYTASLAAGQTKVSEGEEGIKRVTYRNKLVNGQLAESTAVEETVIKEPVHQKTLVGTKTEKTAVKTTSTKKTSSTSSSKSSSSSSNKSSSAAQTSADVKTVSTLQPDAPIALDSKGRPVNYSKLITGKATAYTAPIGSATSTGRGARTGYVAVNPKQIPYGTRLFIRTTDGSYIYGYAVAADTGDFVKKGRITVDLFFNSEGECRTFGVRNVEIYVLD